MRDSVATSAEGEELHRSDSSPEDNVKIKVAAGTNAGDCTLGGEPRLDKGPRVQHTQQGVNEDLWMDQRPY